MASDPNHSSATSTHESGQRWSNWSGNVSFAPDRFSRPRTVDDVVDTVRSSPGRIRTVGSGHSFTELAVTDGTLVSLSDLEGDVSGVDPVNHRALLNAGATLNRLSRSLESYGLGFKNLGDVDVQSLAGAISTGTHGTGRTLPCLSAELSAITVVLADGEVLRIGDGENDHLLPAARVSLGSLGIIVDATVDLRPAYKLHRRTFVQPLTETLADATSMWEKHRNYEFFYLPFCDYAFNIVHDITTEPDRSEGGAGDEDALRDLRRVRGVLRRAGRLRRTLLNQVAKRAPAEDVIGPSWQLLANERTSKFNEMEYHVPVESGMEAFEEIVAAVEANPLVYFPVECRRTAGDSAWLSPFQGGERVSIAVHIAEGDDYRWLFEVIEPILRRHGGRPHWGKLHSMTARELAELYPDFPKFAAVRKELDPTGRFLNPHTAELWGEPFGE